MSKMAILLGVHRPNRSTSKDHGNNSKDKQDDGKEEAKDGSAGYEMFLAWCEAMGITPKDPKKAYSRMCALDEIWDEVQEEDEDEDEGEDNGGY